jgi:hypothetical protein
MTSQDERFQKDTQKQVDSAPAPWHTVPHGTGSLWTLLETYAWNLVSYTDGLTSLRENLQDRLYSARGIGHGPPEITDNDRNSFRILLDGMKPWLNSHALTASLDHIAGISTELEESEPDVDDLIARLKFFNSILENELRRRTFLFIAPDDENLFRNAIGNFALTYAAYPSARHDLQEACRCHALGCYTACVYHCMAIAQVGLHALADDLGVEFSHSIDLAEWQGIIQAIENKIKPMREGPRSDEKDEKLSFYSECAVQFRYFKDAWRNHVAHMREEYDRGQSHSILLHVRDFMEKLSLQVRETWVPVPDKTRPRGKIRGA